MKIAVCDDDVFILEATCKLIDEYAKRPSSKPTTYDKYNHPSDLLKAIGKGVVYDVFILDILMPEYNGIELAKEIRSGQNQAKIIFVTVTPEYAVNSYEVSAFYYLLKPIDANVLFSLLDEIGASLHKEAKSNISINTFGNIINIPVNAIQYVEVLKHKIHFHMKDNKVHTTYGSLKEIASRLETFDAFNQCHKSYIVNLDHVSMIIDHNFKMRNNALVPISRQYYKQMKQTYIRFMALHG